MMAQRTKIFRKRLLLVYLAIILIAILLNSLGKGTKNKIASSCVSTVFYPFKSGWSMMRNFKNYREENLRLKRELASLRVVVDRLLKYEKENERLKKILNFREKKGVALLLGEIVGRGVPRYSGSAVVNVGTKDGVAKNLPAVVPEGLVGKVVYVNAKSSVVQFITDPGFRASVMDRRSRVVGILQPKRTGHLIMSNVPLTEDVQPGDEIVTSGLGGVFPKGLRVGYVVDVSAKPDRIFKNIEIAPFADAAGIEELFILLGSSEADSL